MRIHHWGSSVHSRSPRCWTSWRLCRSLAAIGVFVAIPGTCFPRLTKHKSMLSTRVGMCFFVCACALLLGGPTAGAMLDPHLNSGRPLNFTGMWCYGGAAAMISGFLYIVVRYMLTGPTLMAKA
ncbi:hypothetical protein HBI70_236460 [Parastagonospora nodorum]|nr:hypothetical protein HBH51_227990 [Parastagonospora nodorum]KAH4012140.1 hypothetical protein HBI09_224570 [Parastagonospora nodorum]KAH4215833.1 hypothetical protein HBI06_240510 [Parastagonospora nodorum]KAH4225319.1 hypothetical protein HBI05_229810 [Parastagonospora nodorum]KAH4798785.1 hypothetical protein HBH61_238010 [Parastagonospora nodorum]